jgi:heme/copper-type cytochrome/quinol oxidase subunit 2
MRYKMEKSTKIGLGIFAVIVLAGVFFVFAGKSQGVTGNVVAGSGGLSGNLVGMDSGRVMAGAPCHFMGGNYMGDCSAREIDIEARQWDWSEPTITVKSGELVKIRATSRDVTHGISIPEVGFNLRIDPGRTSIGEFIAPAPGEYAYGCSVMCGPGHGEHRGKLVVL